MLDFSTDTLSPEEAERLRSVFEPLTQSVRELMDATVRSDADADAIAAAKAEIESATARLRSKQLEKTWGLRFTTEGEWLPWANAVVGLRNPVAPPLTVVLEAKDYVWSEFSLGAAYEGQVIECRGDIVKNTRSMVFVRGLMKVGGETVMSFTGQGFWPRRPKG